MSDVIAANSSEVPHESLNMYVLKNKLRLSLQAQLLQECWPL